METISEEDLQQLLRRQFLDSRLRGNDDWAPRRTFEIVCAVRRRLLARAIDPSETM